MSYEANTGLGVSTQYGARGVGGERGNIKTAGAYCEFSINVDADAPVVDFPILDGVVVTEVITDFSTGAITTFTIGGVDVSTAVGTQATYEELANSNTGVIVLAGPSAGKVIVRYLRA